MEGQLSRRERKKQETRLRLMEAALHLFHENGYDDTTVEQIASAADVAKGTFFNYFETKQATLPALVEWRLQRLEEAISSEQGAPTSPVERIKTALRLLANDPLIDPVLARQVFAAIVHQQEPAHHPGFALAQLLAEQIRQAQAAGEIRADLDPVYLGCLVRALFFQQMTTWHHGHCPEPLPETLDKAVDLLLDGVAGPAWRRS
jgi:AcrR family transcriptional regulator